MFCFYSYEVHGIYMQNQNATFGGKRHSHVMYMFHTDTLYNHNKYKVLKSNLFSGHIPRKAYHISKLWVLK